MNIVQVTISTTVILPERGTEAWYKLYSDWMRDEGHYLLPEYNNDEDAFPKTDELLYEYIGTYVNEAAHVGNYTELISSEDVSAKATTDESTDQNIKNAIEGK